MKKIAVIITVFNRKNKTLNCLKNLFKQQLPNNWTIEVFLVNDGCTDGTPEAIQQFFPEVNIILGTGELFWNRGMHLAWDTASKKDDYDFYLWLNDDTYLYKDALKMLIESSKLKNNQSIIGGAVQSTNTGEMTYGGLINNKLSLPNGKLQECDTLHGNFIIVPRYVFQHVGNLDYHFRHAIGDLDYGLRAKKLGIKSFIAPDFVGSCEANETLPKWCLSETPLLDRFRILYSPLGYAEPIPFFIYEKRHFGLLTALKHFFSINLRALLPKLWK